MQGPDKGRGKVGYRILLFHKHFHTKSIISRESQWKKCDQQKETYIRKGCFEQEKSENLSYLT